MAAATGAAYPCRLDQSNKGMRLGWMFLLLAGVCEIFYAAAMPRTDGFTKLAPSLFCAFFICLSMYLLSLATRSIPVGTAYAVWVGIGALGTAWYGIAVLGEDRSVLRLMCFVLILAGIVGLKLLSPSTTAAA
jgi:quaternary ammonium compound-resistance protein SugE